MCEDINIDIATICDVICREYEGTLRQRCTVQSMKPVEYVSESRRMIEYLNKLGVKAETAV